ncbi:hypothetical protein EV401DRAFT_1956553 [Pisolithus croceorrhizus]|nr:hypothetical protein EV401DRAFT_1956553 [Pisolithus croceorrhizus]
MSQWTARRQKIRALQRLALGIVSCLERSGLRAGMRTGSVVHMCHSMNEAGYYYDQSHDQTRALSETLVRPEMMGEANLTLAINNDPVSRSFFSRYNKWTQRAR